MQNLTLITGGVRSGKSRLAEALATRSGRRVQYLATMTRIPGDREQDKRIDKHLQRRPESWLTTECPYNVAETIAHLSNDTDDCVLVDCLSLFITNVLLRVAEDIYPHLCEDAVISECDAVLREMENKPRLQFIVVTNEVGFGIVPETALGRAFRDFLGIANQNFADRAAVVWLTCAGLPLRLKPDLLALQQQSYLQP